MAQPHLDKWRGYQNRTVMPLTPKRIQQPVRAADFSNPTYTATPATSTIWIKWLWTGHQIYLKPLITGHPQPKSIGQCFRSGRVRIAGGSSVPDSMHSAWGRLEEWIDAFS
jgi:hypothetical protein